MKKLTLLAAVVIAASFASCKKDYTCSCTTTVTGIPPLTASTTIKETKKKAKEACEKGTQTNAAGSVKCEIK